MIPLPKKPNIIKKGKNTAVVEIEALYPGYGATIGNSLRRVLLSSLGGAAVTQAKIKNAAHEFSTLPGVLEDAVTIMLNLQKMRFRILSDEPQKAVLKIQGKKDAKGSDFKLPSQLELVNKGCHIATLTDAKAELEIEIRVEKGIGYVPRKSLKKEKQEIGTIDLDAVFSPIIRVALRVENMRVGDRTDFDKLFLEIETDDTITPENAFYQAAEILLQHFALINESFVKEEKKPKKEEKQTPASENKGKKAKVKKEKNEKKKKGKKTE